MDKSYCVNCKKEVPNDAKNCECGGHSFLYGNVKIEDGKVTCKCGNDTMQFTSHMDFKDKAVTVYNCTQCGAVIGNEHYRDAEEMLLWGD